MSRSISIVAVVLLSAGVAYGVLVMGGGSQSVDNTWSEVGACCNRSTNACFDVHEDFCASFGSDARFIPGFSCPASGLCGSCCFENPAGPSGIAWRNQSPPILGQAPMPQTLTLKQ